MRRVDGWRKGGKDTELNRKRDKHTGRDFAGNYRISPINTKINRITDTEWR